MNESPRARLVAYSVAVLAPALSLLLRWPLWPVLENAFPHMTFFPAVMIAAYFGGFWPGLLATGLSGFAANYFLPRQSPSFDFTSPKDVIALTLFVVVGAIISGLGELLRRERRRVVDITEHMRSVQALRESEQRWRSLTEALPQLVWTAKPDGACDYFSMQWTQFTGVPEIHLLGWQWMETLHPDDREPTRKFWLDSVAGRGPYDVEYRVRRTDGEYRWFMTRGVPIRDSDGGIFKWFGTCTDITDLRQTQEALRESEERFRGTFENAAVGIIHADTQGRYLRVNQRYCEIVGYPHDELLTMAVKDVTHPDDLAATMEKYLRLIRGELSSYSEEKRDIRKDGSLIWIHVSASLQRDERGLPLHTIAILQDISVRKHLEEELRKSKEAAESANRAKDEFLANVSHEIRTPMNAILGMTDLVLGTSLSGDQRQSLRTVKTAADNLLSILNDLLDFSKIEAGKLELDLADFSLRAALGDTLRTLAMRAHKKGLELVSHVRPDVPDALVGDAGRLRQVLLNLVGNAIKFTEVGEVLVRVSEDDKVTRWQVDKVTEVGPGFTLSPCHHVTLSIQVSDTGIGIPPEKQEKIFRAFEQEDTSTTRKYGGTGLGLTIAARLVALMGGTIGVDSEPGRGSTFAFTAQFGCQTHPPEQVAAGRPIQLYDLPVLVIDDNATNCQILEEWLRSWQMEPVAVGDGVAAMDTLSDAATRGRPYPLVLLDARMPDTDGLELAAKIRMRPELSATRIILLTSGDMPSNLARLRELRIDAHLLKPAQQDELLETIYQVLRKDEGKRPKDEKEKSSVVDSAFNLPPSSFALNILVAEDNDFNAQLLEQLLMRRGHRVRLARDGRNALSLLGIRGQKSEVGSQKSEVGSQKPEVRGQKSEVRSQRSEVGGQQAEINENDTETSLISDLRPLISDLTSDLRPLTSDLRPLASDFDLLLLDVHMPELDGFQVIQAIRERERSTGGHLPVIALTARSRKEDRDRCLASGMDDFLAKPIQAADLWATIKRVTSAECRVASKDGELANPNPGSSALATHHSSLATRLLDPPVLLAACGGDAFILENICQAFRTGLPNHLATLRDALRDRDSTRLREAAHKLCGMVAAFSTVASGVASDVEDLAAQGKFEDTRPLVEQLELMAEELMGAAGSLSLENLQHKTGPADFANHTDGARD